MAGFDDQRARRGNAVRKPGDLHGDGSVESVGPLDADRKAPSAARVDRRASAFQFDREIRLGPANGESIHVSLPAVAAHVADANQIGPVTRSRECQARVPTEPALAVVVVCKRDGKDRQPVRHQRRAGGMRLNNVARFLEGMSSRTGIEVTAALPVGRRIESDARVRPERHAEDLADFALHVDELVEVHFFPVGHAGIGGRRADGSKRDVRVAYRLKQQARHGCSVEAQYFNPGVHRCAELSRLRFDHPTLARLRLEPKQIHVARRIGRRRTNSPADGPRRRDRRGLLGLIVRFDLHVFGPIAHDDLQVASPAQLSFVQFQRHLAGRGGLHAHGCRIGKVEPDQFDIRVGVRRDAQRKPARHVGEFTYRQAIEVVRR